MFKQFAVNHFGLRTVKKLDKKGIRIIGLTSIPDEKGSFLNSTTGYTVDDNGTGRVLSFLELSERAK